MNLTKTTRLLTIASTFICLSAVAQTRFCIGGDLDHLSTQEKLACSAKLQAVKQTAAALRAPENWHFVVVCGEDGWKSYAAFASQGSAALLRASSDTHFEQRETYLRGDRLDVEDLRRLRQVFAHEVAGIVLKSTDEVAIEHLVEQWQIQRPEQAGF